MSILSYEDSSLRPADVRFYDGLPDGPLIAKLYANAALHHAGYRQFGRITAVPAGEGFSLGYGDMDEPLYPLSGALTVPRARSAGAGELAAEITRLFARRFRVEDRYFDPS